MILNKYFLKEITLSPPNSPTSNRHHQQTSRNLSPGHATPWLQTSKTLSLSQFGGVGLRDAAILFLE